MRANIASLSALLLTVSLGACTSIGGQRASLKDVEVVGHTETSGMDPIAKAAFWGTRYDRTPSDPVVASQFAKSLRAIDNNEEALRVVQHASTRVQNDPELLLEKGKALIANDRAHEAVRAIETAISIGKMDDWSAWSSLGVAYDMTGNHKKARQCYDQALSIEPNKVQILNNKGLSYALSGNKQMATNVLRLATNSPEGTARVRQNYALVLALSGQKSEAERLARSDLPPIVADGNVNYYRSLSRQAAYWGSLNDEDLNLPDFGDDPATVSMTPAITPVPEPVPSPTPGYGKKKSKPAPSAPAKSTTRSTNVQASVEVVPQRVAAVTADEPIMIGGSLPTLTEAELAAREEQSKRGGPMSLFFRNEN